MGKSVTSSQICDTIAATHAPPEWACFYEVGNKTGYGVRRHADAVAMSIWPSRGLILRGFEVKVSRSDYRNEAKDPLKAETIAAYCDEWWLVTLPGLIVDVNTELPPAWGLFEAAGNKLVTRRAATRTEAKPIDRGFLAAILRRAHEMTNRNAGDWIRRDSIEDRIEKARAQGKTDIPYEIQRIQTDNDRLNKKIKEFFDRTGIDINGGYDAGNVASCYRLGRIIGGKYGKNISSIVMSLQDAKNNLDLVLSEIESLEDEEKDKK